MLPLFRAVVKFCSTNRLFTYFLYVVYGKEVDSGSRKLNFTPNFDIGHKKGVLHLTCSSIALYSIGGGVSGPNMIKLLNVLSKFW